LLLSLFALLCAGFFYAPSVAAIDLNLTNFGYAAPIYVQSNGYPDRMLEPLAIDLNISCAYEDKRDLRIIYRNESLANFRRIKNDTRAIVKLNATSTIGNDYWLYCDDPTATDLNNESFFRVYDDFEREFDQTQWKVQNNGSYIRHDAANGRVELQSGGLISATSMVYNATNGYYNNTEPSLFYGAIASTPSNGDTDPQIPYRSVGFAETNVLLPEDNDAGDPPFFAYGSVLIAHKAELLNEECYFRINDTGSYSCDTNLLYSTSIINFYKNATNHIEYLHNNLSKTNSTQPINNTNMTALFHIERAFDDEVLYAYTVAMDTELFYLYEPQSNVTVGAQVYGLINVSSPTIVNQTYFENDSMVAYALASQPNNNSLRAEIFWNTTRGINYTQYISSIASFEHGHLDGWSGASIVDIWATEGNKSVTGDTITKSVNLSDYDFAIVDFDLSTINDDNFIIYLNASSGVGSTQLHYAQYAGTKGTIQTNYYINLSSYGGVSTFGFKRDKCFSCTSGSVRIDNIRFGSLTELDQYNISSNTNITTLLPADLNVFDVDDNVTAVFTLSDGYSLASNTSNLVNISNRIGTVANITIAPLPFIETDDIYVQSFNYTDPDDSHTNVSQDCRWYKNDAYIWSGCALSNGNYSTGDLLNVELRATDGYNYSAWTNSSIVVVGDTVAPVLGNYSIPTTGRVGVTLTLTVQCEDSLSDIAQVTINLTTPGGQYSINTFTSSGNSTYTLGYVPGSAGTYVWNGSSCVDTSGNTNYTAVYATTSVSPLSSDIPRGGGGGGEPTVINQTIIKKPENESFYRFRTPTGSAATDLLMLPRENRTIPLILTSLSKDPLNVRLLCINGTGDICDYISFDRSLVVLEPLDSIEILVTVNTDRLLLGEFAEVGLAARLIGADGSATVPVEQDVVRVKVLVSWPAYVLGYLRNFGGSYAFVPKWTAYLLFGGVLAVLVGLVLQSGPGMPLLLLLVTILTLNLVDFIIFLK